jgi:hypothetical protein
VMAASMHVLMSTVGACKSRMMAKRPREGGRIPSGPLLKSRMAAPIKVIDAVGIGPVGPVGRRAWYTGAPLSRLRSRSARTTPGASWVSTLQAADDSSPMPGSPERHHGMGYLTIACRS